MGFLALLSTTLTPVFGVGASANTPVGTLYLGDLLMPLAAVCLLPRVLFRPGHWIIVTMVGAAAWLMILGLWNGAELAYLARDGRSVIYGAAGAIIGLYLARRPRPELVWMSRVLAFYLLAMGVLVVLTQWMPILVSADTKNAVIVGGSVTEFESPRSQIVTNPLSQFVLSGLAAGALASGRLPRAIGPRRFWWLLASVTLMLFLSYSRNTLLGLGVPLLVAIGVTAGRGSPGAIAGVSRRGLFAAAGVTVLGLSIVASGAFRAQIDTYAGRVVAGLSSRGLTEPGVLWRETESRYANEAIRAAPVLGTGLGTFYRPNVPGDPFPDEGGRLYVHNYYQWAVVKGGVFYGLLLLVFFAGALLRGLRVGTPPGVAALAYGIIGLLACAPVAPWPGQQNGAALLWAAAAACWVAAREHSVGTRPGIRGDRREIRA